MTPYDEILANLLIQAAFLATVYVLIVGPVWHWEDGAEMVGDSSMMSSTSACLRSA